VVRANRDHGLHELATDAASQGADSQREVDHAATAGVHDPIEAYLPSVRQARRRRALRQPTVKMRKVMKCRNLSLTGRW
jgi:hypothetical protein